MKNQKILNSFKISITCVFAIFCANVLSLEFSASAGIVAILTIAPTKKETLKTAIHRFYAFIIALFISFVCFSCAGYNLYGFFLYLLLFVFVCQLKNWTNAMAMNSVLISHFLTFQTMNMQTISNEILIFILGTGCGILVNLHLRENIDFMEQMQKETDTQVKNILSRMAQRVANRDMQDYNGTCFTAIKKSLAIANNIAEENFLNKFREKDSWNIKYIALRERQTHILYNIYKKVRNLQATPVTAQIISNFIQKLSDAYGKDNSGKGFLDEFYLLRASLRQSPLPKTRKEFEDRAELYGILNDIEDFILAKVEFFDETN